MSCSQNKLKECLLGEVSEAECREVERHVAECESCSGEWSRMQLTRAALLTLADEEMPRRIGFVSDPVLAPSLSRRWWGEFWHSGARLGFASAAMVSAALLVFALRLPAGHNDRPAPRTVERIQYVSRDNRAEIQTAVATAIAAERKRTDELIASSEQRQQRERRALMISMQETVSLMQKRYNVNLVSSANFGAGQ